MTEDHHLRGVRGAGPAAGPAQGGGRGRAAGLPSCPAGGQDGRAHLEQQDELREPLDGLHHQAVERDTVRARLRALLRGSGARSHFGAGDPLQALLTP